METVKIEYNGMQLEVIGEYSFPHPSSCPFAEYEDSDFVIKSILENGRDIMGLLSDEDFEDIAEKALCAVEEMIAEEEYNERMKGEINGTLQEI